MWVTFEVYRAFNKAAVPSVPANVSAPLTPALDQETLSKLEAGLFLDDSQISDSIISAPVLSEPEPETPAPEEVPEETPENSPIPAPENATGSGESI